MSLTAVSSVALKLGNLLIEEGLLLYGVRNQVEWVKDELLRIRSFLKDADAKQRRGDDRVKNWVREVTDVAYRVEDIIDTFMLKVKHRRRRGFVGFVKRYALFPYELIARHMVGVEIEEIRAKIRDIKEARDTFGIANLGETGEEGSKSNDEILAARIRGNPDLDDGMDVVGFDVYRKKVVNQLLDNNIPRRCVVSIVGMGGLGKTTLAKKVYNSPEIKTKFPICVWITVSQEYGLRDLLNGIIRKVMGITKDELERIEEDDRERKLYDFLKERTYLIVMDDIWRTDLWGKMQAVLPDVMNGSRVLFTTRYIEVARSADPQISPFELPSLNDDESWKLFTKKAFSTTGPGDFKSGCCPEELKELGQRFVKRCDGLPLALVVLGGLLSRKVPTSVVWRQMEERLDWAQDGSECLKILALSYNDLPNHYLKSCFLYIALFPEDFMISASELARLWIAEGFIPPMERQTMEDTAIGYLEELVQRSMIQVVRRRITDGGISRCRIHDLLRDMCLEEAKQGGFLNVYRSNTPHNSSVVHDVPPRRLALHNLTDVNSHSYPKLRSLFVGVGLEKSYNLGGGLEAPHRFIHGLKLLRVLKLCGVIRGLTILPKEIALMTHLRYLDLRGCFYLKKLPSSIGKLRNLLSLDIRNTKIKLLPKELIEIVNLRHLYVNMYCKLLSISTLRELQTLKHVNNFDGNIRKNLRKLTNLRCLSIGGDDTDLYKSLGNLNRLVSLKLASDFLAEAITALSNNHYLQKLYLRGWSNIWSSDRSITQTLPDIFPPNLSKLTLAGTNMDEDPMTVLGKLPNLMFLELNNTCSAMTMVCTTGGFPKLQQLRLAMLLELCDLRVEAGAFPNLTYLYISNCTSLTMLPEGLQHVTSLRELVLLDEREDFRDRCKDGGEDWSKIKDVQSITVLAASVPANDWFLLNSC